MNGELQGLEEWAKNARQPWPKQFVDEIKRLRKEMGPLDQLVADFEKDANRPNS